MLAAPNAKLVGTVALKLFVVLDSCMFGSEVADLFGSCVAVMLDRDVADTVSVFLSGIAAAVDRGVAIIFGSGVAAGMEVTFSIIFGSDIAAAVDAGVSIIFGSDVNFTGDISPAGFVLYNEDLLFNAFLCDTLVGMSLQLIDT